jgi:nucleotide-binding universal stress UspA family protein
MYDRITLTTDLSPASQPAFLHALALARWHRSTLDILHVRDPSEDPHMEDFPQVRSTLQKWGVRNLPPALSRGTSIDGLKINKVDVPASNAAASLSDYMERHGTRLIIAANHGRSGLSRLLHGSVTENLLRETGLPALLFGPHAQGFISPEFGTVHVERVVIPLATEPPPGPAYDELLQFLDGPPARLLPLHVSGEPSHFDDGDYEGAEIRVVTGSVADAVIGYADAENADLIVMATEGAHGLKDRLFGSTASQVMAHAPCPVLLVPAR